MKPVPATLQESPWYRLVRCLVLLWVAALERRIAGMVARMEALPEDARYDAEFARLDDRCYELECLRDRYLAWLEDPFVPLPRALAAHDLFGGRARVARVRVRVPAERGVRPARGGGRCTTTSVIGLERPWVAAMTRVRRLGKEGSFTGRQ